MKNFLLILIILLLGYNGFSQSRKERREQENERVKLELKRIEQKKIDSINAKKEEAVLMLKEIEQRKKDSIDADIILKTQVFYKTNALIFPKGIYDGYINYNGGIELPKGYGFYINKEFWKNFIEENESDFYSNLEKFKTLSEESKFIYRNSYQQKLLQIASSDIGLKDLKSGKYPYTKILLEIYLEELNSGKINSPKKSYSSENISVYGKSFDLTEWYSLIDKYNFKTEVENTINLKNDDNVDLIVGLIEKLNSEEHALNDYLKYQEGYKYYTKIASTVIIKEEVATLEEFDSSVAEVQKQYPGQFRDKNRLKITRDAHIQKIKNSEIEYEKMKEAKKKAELELLVTRDIVEDLDFKTVRIAVLKDILLKEGIDKRISDYENGISSTPTILDEWYMKEAIPIALLIINNELVPVGQPSSLEMLTNGLSEIGVQFVPLRSTERYNRAGELTEKGYYTPDGNFIRIKLIQLEEQIAVIEIIGSTQSYRPIIEGPLILNINEKLVEISNPKKITSQAIELYNDYLNLKKSRLIKRNY